MHEREGLCDLCGIVHPHVLSSVNVLYGVCVDSLFAWALRLLRKALAIWVRLAHVRDCLLHLVA